MNDNAALRLLYLGLPPIGEQEPTALPFSPEALAASPLALTAADLATIPALFAAAWTERDDGGNRELQAGVHTVSQDHGSLHRHV